MFNTKRNLRGNVMPFVKIGPKHQITIPKQIFSSLELKAGDFIEVMIQGGKVVLIPKQITEKPPVPKLSEREQGLLSSAKAKIAAINKDMLNANGLTQAEADVAAKVGLIDPEQKWWWTEEWQKGERQAEADMKAGRISGPFESAAELIQDLES